MNDLLLPSRTIGLNENQLYILYRVLIRCLKTSGSFGFICLGRGGPVTTNPPKQNDWLKKNSILKVEQVRYAKSDRLDIKWGNLNFF